MPSRAKIAISIDARLLARIERLREDTGESRSALIGRALTKLTSESAHEEQVRRYVTSYREQPETPADIAGARGRARRTLARLPWKDA